MKFSTTFAAIALAASTLVEASTHDFTAIHHPQHNKIHRRGNAYPKCNRQHRPSARTSVDPKSNHTVQKAPAAAAKVVNKVTSQNPAIANSGSCSNKAAGPTTRNGGPNGAQGYLNCGINGAGWNPPYINVHSLAYVDLNSARHSAFSSCTDEMIGLFYKYGAVHDIPPILIASFAMQESGCNPNTIGGAGEQGLMQITQEKCGQLSMEECRGLDYNIGTGAAYFASQLEANGGNLVKTVGSYNGWFDGMTYYDATKAAHTDCCRCQNNLDYLQQFFNGWLQGHNAYNSNDPLGTYFNLAKCF